jgi:alpha-1,3/alpha-1,6-mannosyltransferase
VAQILLRWGTFDIAVVDQLSVGHLLLRLKAHKLLFYCHFPDLHLSKRTSALKRLYRVPFDWLERVTTGKQEATQFTIRSAVLNCDFAWV